MHRICGAEHLCTVDELLGHTGMQEEVSTLSVKPNLSITVSMRLGQVSSALDMASIPIYHLRRVNLGRPLCDRNIYARATGFSPGIGST